MTTKELIKEAGRRGPFIMTADGPFNFFDSSNSRGISLRSIAQSLASTVRFRGLTDRFYSVAWHSIYGAVLIENLFPEEWEAMGVTPGCIPYTDEDIHETALGFLLHDAAEAFIGDIPKPLKDRLGVRWWGETNTVPIDELERDILSRIYSHLRLRRPCGRQATFIKHVDRIMLTWEISWLFGKEVLEVLEGVMEVDGRSDQVSAKWYYDVIASVSPRLNGELRELYSQGKYPIDIGRDVWISAVKSLQGVQIGTDISTAVPLPLELPEESQ
jgi:hypothetical protein